MTIPRRLLWRGYLYLRSKVTKVDSTFEPRRTETVMLATSYSANPAAPLCRGFHRCPGKTFPEADEAMSRPTLEVAHHRHGFEIVRHAARNVIPVRRMCTG